MRNYSRKHGPFVVSLHSSTLQVPRDFRNKYFERVVVHSAIRVVCSTVRAYNAFETNDNNNNNNVLYFTCKNKTNKQRYNSNGNFKRLTSFDLQQ